jgi:hypothetical protein
MKRRGENQRESAIFTPYDFSLGSIQSLLERSMPKSFDLCGITCIVHSDLPAQTAYLQSSDQCYELALDGDGLRIVRQFKWPQYKLKSLTGSLESSANGWLVSFQSTFECH